MSRTPLFDAKNYSSNLPSQPGVYRMLGVAGKVIYVGKAINLRKRVSSYFQKTNLTPRIQLMVSQITGIETTVTRSEIEALLLENNLIKALTPRYNILFKDDKSYPYILLTGHQFPRLVFHRGALDKCHRYFGPFPNVKAVRESIQLLQKIFRIRTCEDSVFNNRTRPCLLYQIRRCSAPCVDKITNETYREEIKNAELFLLGEQTEVLKSIAKKMQDAVRVSDYEQAASFRDQIQALRGIQEKQFVDSGKDLDADVISCVVQIGGGKLCINLTIVRGGRHLGDKNFFPKNSEGYDSVSAVEAFISQHYLNYSAPRLIIVGEKIHREILQKLLCEQSNQKIFISLNPVGKRRVWLNMATENARLGLERLLSDKITQEERVQALQQTLNIPVITHIECFDISHTQGEATVASCVVYKNFSMRNNEYRRYNINEIIPGDDCAAMYHVLLKRYHKFIEEQGSFPDLILIDGGKGQIGAAKRALAELGLNNKNLIGVVKGEGRKPGLERLIFADQKKSLQLSGGHPGLHLIQQIRDEAHRFAIQGHRARRDRSRVKSSLEEINGVGIRRRQNLLTRFGGLKGVLIASVEELRQTEGVSLVLAEKIYKKLH